MRILYYNWVDYLDDENRGGGVTQYQRNVLKELDRQDGIKATFLSSGISYDLLRRVPRWEQMRHGPAQDRHRRYEIVNSGVLSPAHHSFGQASQLRDDATLRALHDFIDATGPYDVVHFNNLEGLPVQALDLKSIWPDTRVILSLHNYYPFCPQVNLWHQERETCTDFDQGRTCVHCLPHTHNAQQLKLANGLAYHLKSAGLRPGSTAFEALFRPTIKVGRRVAMGLKLLRRGGKPLPKPGRLAPLSAPDGTPFAARRAQMVQMINDHCDRVLCVSDAVGHIAERFGVRRDLLKTSYIGTAEADCFTRTRPKPSLLQSDGTFSMAYLGYMRRDKGFFFLLEALESLPEPLAKRIRLVVAARDIKDGTLERLSDLGARLGGLSYADGYTHDGLDDLLKNVDLGVIPVLWNDNLPQVAIEMHARHIPLLTSDLGGAQELAHCPQMVFRAGDVEAFHARLRAILSGQIDLAAYWAGARAPVSMPQHLDELRAVYAGSEPVSDPIPAAMP
ncbi:glycosyltransferase [Thalassobius sp. S69A]|uniref:glycosyltransferase n=1 Tax=unclassified Thalassovita TaxID=2619711 RepID=UPI000C108F10|nr:glycosyltransferase [Paracoccaceae bacterium]MBA86362.1 glycosyltransferase [Paracoccaceae bacterium]MBT26889.1 glycosyltransferase [Paracoccaceae bacterium]